MKRLTDKKQELIRAELDGICAYVLTLRKNLDEMEQEWQWLRSRQERLRFMVLGKDAKKPHDDQCEWSWRYHNSCKHGDKGE